MGLRIGAITFQGLASGFPTEDVIEKILELEHRPIDILETRKSDFQTKLSIFQDLNSKTTNLRDILREIDNMNLVGTDQSAFEEFRQLRAESSDETIATASATGSATRGSLVIRVDQLAQQERELSDGFLSSTTTIGTGSLTIDVGGAGPQAITIDATNDTVEGLVTAINDAGLGVSAFIIDDGGATATPIHIAVVSEETGAAQSIAIDTSGLSGGPVPTFTETQTAQDAQITLDPGSAAELPIASPTNVFDGVLAGLTIEARKADPASLTIAVRTDEDSIVDRLSDMVAAYNDIVDIIQEQSKVDPNTNRGGPLSGDSTLVSLKQRMATVISSVIGSGDVSTAKQMGLSLDREGALQLDESALRSTLASSFDAGASFFSGPGSLADQIRGILQSYVDPVDGLLVTRINGTTQSIKDLDDSIDRAEDRLDTIEENLVQQFAAMERIVSRLRQQGDFLSQFLLTQTSNR